MKKDIAGRLWRCRAPLLVLLAFALRAAFLLQWFELPYLSLLSSDAWSYDNWALEILEDGPVRHTAFYQSPLYPYLLAAFYKVFGHQPTAVLWLQALADSFTCLLIMRIGARCFGEKEGFIAGLLAALYRPFIFSAAIPGKETLAVLGAAAFTLLALRAGESGRKRDYFYCGLAGGAAALLRSNFLLLPPALLLWASFRLKGRRLIRTAVLPLLLGTVLPLAPATLHNLAASGDPVLINYNGGFTFYLGNNPEATGAGIYPEGFSSFPPLEESQPAVIAAAAEGRALKPSEVSAFWLKKGLGFIADNPGRWLGLTAAKFFFFWNRYEIPDNYDLQFITDKFDTVLSWPLISFALAGCLGAAGLFLCRMKEPSGLLLSLLAAYLLSLLPFWITDRYRLPALVMLLPLAGASLRQAYAAAALRDRRALHHFICALPLIVLCLLPPPFKRDFSDAVGWRHLMMVRASAGDREGALEALRSSAAADPAALSSDSAGAAAYYLDKSGDKDGGDLLLSEWARLAGRHAAQ